MIRDFRLFRSGVSARVLGIGILIAILFVTGCTTSGNGEAQLAVATLAGGLPAGSVSVGGGAYPSTTITATGGTAPYTTSRRNVCMVRTFFMLPGASTGAPWRAKRLVVP